MTKPSLRIPDLATVRHPAEFLARCRPDRSHPGLRAIELDLSLLTGHLEIHPSDEDSQFDSVPSKVPGMVGTGVVQRWRLPPLTVPALARWIDDAQPLLRAVLAGATTTWTSGNGYVADLDAEAAGAAELLAERATEMDADAIDVRESGDLAAIEDGVSIDLDDGAAASMAAEIEWDVYRATGVWPVGVLDAILVARNREREQLLTDLDQAQDDLDQAAAEVGLATARRDRALIQCASFASSYDLAERCSLSPSTVQRTLRAV